MMAMSKDIKWVEQHVKSQFSELDNISIVQVAEIFSYLNEFCTFIKNEDVEYIIDQAEIMPTLEMSFEQTMTLIKTLYERQRNQSFLVEEKMIEAPSISKQNSLIDLDDRKAAVASNTNLMDMSFLKPFAVETEGSVLEAFGTKSRRNVFNLSVKSIIEDKDENLDILTKVKSLMQEKKELFKILNEKEESYLDYIKNQEQVIERLQRKYDETEMENEKLRRQYSDISNLMNDLKDRHQREIERLKLKPSATTTMPLVVNKFDSEWIHLIQLLSRVKDVNIKNILSEIKDLSSVLVEKYKDLQASIAVFNDRK